MQVDKTTLTDLSIFHQEEAYSVFHRLNFTRTAGGKDYLHHFLNRPLDNIRQILETQQTLQRFMGVQEQLSSTIITNGTVMVIEKFYDTPVAEIPRHPGLVNTQFYRIFNGPDLSLIRYSVKHFIDFIIGLNQTLLLLSGDENPVLLQVLLNRIKMLLQKPALRSILQKEAGNGISLSGILKLGHFMKRDFKEETFELIDIYSRLDAYYSMATACKNHAFCFPELVDSPQSLLSAKAIYHPLLAMPVSCDLTLMPDQNFLFLTGANMAGKSTFIKAAGIAVYLAHTGMGVPAKEMRLSLFNGLLSNINVVDNIVQGESYFFNEVQRIRNTVEKISDGKKWLILIDELFKGTNVLDAMKCSSTVIEGLRKMRNALFILSTHLYEIGESLRQYPNIQFRYFETSVAGDQLVFSYQLKEGISNDRLGYLILRKEGVVKMLENL
ncbi:MAG: MutS family DNA mismatch repair protein [Sediminibacterium sp.]